MDISKIINRSRTSPTTNPEPYEAPVSSDSNNNGKYPILIERRLKGYRTATFIFIGFALISWAISGSVFSVAFGLVLALLIGIMSIVQKREIDRNGFENWHFRVIEHTYLLNIKRRQPTGLYATALDGPYEGQTCHISLSGRMVTPPLDQQIELCVPKNITASPIGGIYYIPKYYGLALM